MKVYANGFQLVCTGPVAADQVFAAFVEHGVYQFTYNKRKRVLAVERHGKFFCGCVLSNRDTNTYLTLETDSSGTPFAKHRKMDGGPPLDFSFFILSAQHMNGIFTQYIGSGGLTQFASMLRDRHKTVLDDAKETAIEEAAANGDDDGEAAVSKSFRGTIYGIPLVTNPDFANELNRLRDIARFEFLVPRYRNSHFTSPGTKVEYARTTVGFDKKNSRVGELRKAIANFIVGDGVKEGKAYGHNGNGDWDHVAIQAESLCMANYPYNDIAQGEIRLGGFAQQEPIKKLIALTKPHPDLF